MAKKKRKIKARYIIIGVVALVIVLIVASIVVGNYQKQFQPVRSEEVATGNITSTVSGPGKVDPRISVDISANIMGKVDKIYVEEGDSVKAGDIILELEQTEYRAGSTSAYAGYRSAQSSLESAEVSWRAAKEAFARKQQLYDEELISDEAYDFAQSEYEKSRAQYEMARNQLLASRADMTRAYDALDKTVYAAPIDGVITALNIEEGEFTVVGTLNTPGTVMATVADLAAMEVEADINETDIVDVELGQISKITVDAYPDRIFKGKVVEIASSATTDAYSISDAETAADFKIRVLIESEAAGLKPGMSATVDVVTDEVKEVVAVPIQAIATRDRETVEEWKEKNGNKKKSNGKNKPKKISGNVFERDDVEGVFVVEGKKVKFVEVKTGISGEQYIEVTEGVKPGTEIVVGPYRTLRELSDGDKIKVTPNIVEEE
ncbi:MAG: efflux RND transporter periplasmic adaptor subunit [bacterium]|nr:efflux RND transporter periplasmic adaptor subunit [bacterium]